MDTKDGVFISHIAEEKKVANALKELLHRTFGSRLRIFVSSDYESIGSGQDWFDSIRNALRVAQVVLVLLSEASVDRRWINFEAGVGVGAYALVIPLVFRGLTKEKIGLPLSPLHARSLYDSEDVRATINDTCSVCRLDANPPDLSLFVSELKNLERSLPSREVLVEPFLRTISGSFLLQFKLSNIGSRDVELVMIEVSVPRRYLSPDWTPASDPNLMEAVNHTMYAEPYLTLKFKVFEGSTHPSFGIIERLPRFLSPGMPPQELKPPFAFPLRENLKETNGIDVPILYAVYAKGMQPEKGETTYRKLVMSKFSKGLIPPQAGPG